jgi:SAM-dependent methyltransferase
MGFSIRADLEKNMDGGVLLHRFRYHLGAGFCTHADIVLDLACGQGYGTYILSQHAKKVTGVDIDQPQISANKQKYQGKSNLFFMDDNLETMDVPECDVACSFETIEHLYNPAQFINNLKSKTKKYIIASVPFGCEKLVVRDGDVQADLDSTHHSVFDSPLVLDNMFIDEKWKKFYGVISGVTYICVYYNSEIL